MNLFNVARICLGIFYLVSCIFNLFHTLHNSQYLWTVCLENAHFSFYKEFLKQIVIPNEKLIILLIVAFEFIVGVLILSEGFFVKIGLILAILWVLFITPFLPLGDILGHLVLGTLQAILLMENYNTPFWEIIRIKIQRT